MIERFRWEPPFCACSCGGEVGWNGKRWNRFIHGHHGKGKKRPDISKMMNGPRNPMRGKDMTGENNPMFGKKRPDMSERLIGNQHSKGFKHSKEFCEAISKRMLGMKHPGLSERMRKNNPMKKPEVIMKVSGKNSSAWRGGIAAEPYCDVWLDKEYKESILERDNYTCQNPDCWGAPCKLHIHHIDYIKKNCSPWNLLTLCNSCNTRANKNRDYWQELYQDIVTTKQCQPITTRVRN